MRHSASMWVTNIFHTVVYNKNELLKHLWHDNIENSAYTNI